MARNWHRCDDGSFVLREGPRELGCVIAVIRCPERHPPRWPHPVRWRLVDGPEDLPKREFFDVDGSVIWREYGLDDDAGWFYARSVSQAMEFVADALDAAQLEAYADRAVNPIALLAAALTIAAAGLLAYGMFH